MKQLPTIFILFICLSGCTSIPFQKASYVPIDFVDPWTIVGHFRNNSPENFQLIVLMPQNLWSSDSMCVRRRDVLSSDGSSWNAMAMVVARPSRILTSKLAPTASPSAKLCNASPTVIIQATKSHIHIQVSDSTAACLLFPVYIFLKSR